ncbi:MAG: porin family protein [Cyclobacteriaceae bacterium]
MNRTWLKVGTGIAIAILFLAIEAEAQLAIGARGGVMVGKPGFSRAYRSIYLSEYNVGFAPGFTIGAVADIKVGSMFSLQNELNYSLKGVRIKRGGSDYVQNTMMLHYLDYPILLKTRLNKGRQKYYLTFGPTISYWLGGNMNIRANELDEWGIDRAILGITYNPDNALDVKSIYVPEANRFQFGLSIGGGIENELHNGQRFIFDLRYDIGHTFLSKEREVDIELATYQANMESNNHMISFSVIFVYDLNTLRRNLAK